MRDKNLNFPNTSSVYGGDGAPSFRASEFFLLWDRQTDHSFSHCVCVCVCLCCVVLSEAAPLTAECVLD